MPQRKILIIDDNAMNREMAADLLTEAGFGVLLAMDGEAGLLMAREENPDLILVDLHLPNQDGFELTRTLKTLPGLKETPIIAFTAMAMRSEQEAALASGCDGVISKPIDIKSFPAIIKQYLHHSLPTDPDNNRLSQADEREAPALTTQLLEALVQHDLKSPLCSVDTGLHLLSSGKLGALSEEQQNLVNEIQAANDSVLSMLDILYAIFLYENNDYMLHAEPTDPHRLIGDCLKTDAKKLLGPKEIITRLTLAPTHPLLNLDTEVTSRIICLMIGIFCREIPRGSELHLSTCWNQDRFSIILGSTETGIKPIILEPRMGRNEENMHYLKQDAHALTALEITYCKLYIRALGGDMEVNADPAFQSSLTFHFPVP